MTTKYVSPQVYSAIDDGKQTFIGKINAGFWQDLAIGDRLIITDGQRTNTVEISGLSYFSNFGDAWFTLGDALVPSHIENIVTESDAIRYFRKYYKDSDVAVCGVIAVKICIV